MAVCKCDAGLVNSGIPSCVSGFGKVVKLFFVYQNDFAGASNALDCSVPFDQSVLDALLNKTDPSQRWYPTGLISTVTEERADPTTETIDNKALNVEAGVRTFQGFFIGSATASPSYLKFLNSLECPKVMYYAVDANNNIIGVERNGSFWGFTVQEKSIYSKFIPATSTTIAKNQLNFTLDDLVQDKDISFIDEVGADLLGANGLIDVNLAEGNISGTFESVGVVGTLTYGSCNNKLKYTAGTLVTDWLVYNKTTLSVVTVTSVSPIVDGNNYTLNFTAQNSGDVLEVSVVKEGFASEIIEITFP